ncbi:MAG: peptidoglycan editing factor PgeF [Bdellovibrionales bacterium]|nr:peptidoglycan editing factor PgeF [Bdellovibrionales bacterium]
MEAIQSRLLSEVPGLIHGFGTRAEPVPRGSAPLWEPKRPRWRQVHGAEVAEAIAPGQDLGDCDGIFTLARQLPVAVQTADCVPLLFAREDGGAVAAVHAGWKGTYAGIVGAMWKALRPHGAEPGHWKVAIGPSIRGCCYEVSPELAVQFRERFTRKGAASFLTNERFLDLQQVNALQLRELGFSQVETIELCTRCSREGSGSEGPPAFFSHRYKPGEGRQWAVAHLA